MSKYHLQQITVEAQLADIQNRIGELQTILNAKPKDAQYVSRLETELKQLEAREKNHYDDKWVLLDISGTKTTVVLNFNEVLDRRDIEVNYLQKDIYSVEYDNENSEYRCALISEDGRIIIENVTDFKFCKNDLIIVRGYGDAFGEYLSDIEYVSIINEFGDIIFPHRVYTEIVECNDGKLFLFGSNKLYNKAGEYLGECVEGPYDDDNSYSVVKVKGKLGVLFGSEFCIAPTFDEVFIVEPNRTPYTFLIPRIGNKDALFVMDQSQVVYSTDFVFDNLCEGPLPYLFVEEKESDVKVVIYNSRENTSSTHHYYKIREVGLENFKMVVCSMLGEHLTHIYTSIHSSEISILNLPVGSKEAVDSILKEIIWERCQPETFRF